ncbi:MAG: cation-translocating P-type ATPase, partial [Planctomycetota bacterium]
MSHPPAAFRDAIARPVEAILDEQSVSPEDGLAPEEARRRREQYGPNLLAEFKPKSAWAILVSQFKSLMVLLLTVAAVVALAFEEWLDGAAIGIVLAINAAIGFFTEIRAVRSMEALRRLGSMSAKVRRGGELREAAAEDLVPGDIVVLEGGDVVAADVRLLEASKLQVDESALTGESVPVDKQTEPVDAEAPIAECSNMVFRGTAITRGSGEGVVVATGMDTEIGRIAELAAGAGERATPLEKRLDALGRKLIGVTVGIAAVVSIVGIVQDKDAFLMIETGIALAVATIPEGLPIVATIALARGMWRMARRNALINRLSAVETLGATRIICTDKTGTLTENQMTATQMVTHAGETHIDGERFTRDGDPVQPDEGALRAALEVGVLCNNAEISEDGEAVGDPMEVALLVAGRGGGIDRAELEERLPEVREEAFDADVKMMATYHQDSDGVRVAVKGAPEAVLGVCTRILAADGERQLTDDERQQWLDRNRQEAEEGLRLLAAAQKTVQSAEAKPYEGLTFLALVGLLDPPREEVREAIDTCQAAGIEVVMITGDQPITARNVALAVGLVDNADVDVVQGSELKAPEELDQQGRQRILAARIFARVSPEQKLNLVTLHQDAGNIVAMTGDGVNDAPALKQADIGVAMGQRGTQVAREAADMVLRDDAFSSIVAAVEQGRVIFNNIRKFVLYLLSCNVSEVAIVGVGSLVAKRLPLLPLQILLLNFVTDVFPALALGVGEGDPKIMDRPPRDSKEPILASRHWGAIVYYGGLMTASVLGVYLVALRSGMDYEPAVTISFLTLAFSQLFHVFNMRDRGSS